MHFPDHARSRGQTESCLLTPPCQSWCPSPLQMPLFPLSPCTTFHVVFERPCQRGPVTTPPGPGLWSLSRGLTSQWLSSLVSEMSMLWCCSFSSSNRACQQFSSSCELFREVFSSLVWACSSSYSPFSWRCRKLTLGAESHRPRAEGHDRLCPCCAT